MKHTVSLVLGAVALAVAFVTVPAVSPAQPAPTFTPVPAAKPDLSSMMFLTGTWTCTQMLRGKARPDTSTTTVGLDGASHERVINALAEEFAKSAREAA